MAKVVIGDFYIYDVTIFNFCNTSKWQFLPPDPLLFNNSLLKNIVNSDYFCV